MADIIYRYDPEHFPSPPSPATSEEARLRLEEGNREFSQLLDPLLGKSPRQPRIIPFDPEDLGMCLRTGQEPKQQPFAVVLGCSDARVPTEFIFNQGCNDLFVVRVAGNVLGAECLGSIDYALTNFGSSLKLIVVLGHSGCGAVTAAVDAYLDPSRYLAVATTHQLRAIVDRLFVSVRAAAQSVEAVWGPEAESKSTYRQGLVGMAVVLNAALSAAILRKEFVLDQAAAVKVVYSVYDLTERKLRLPGIAAEGPDLVREVGLIEPPCDLDGYRELGIRLAACDPLSRYFR